MLAGTIDTVSQQARLTPLLEKAFSFLRRTDLASLPDGRIEIDGDRVFAIVQRYETVLPGSGPLFEYHRTYIDVQAIVSGREVIGWAPADRIAVTEAYDAGRDIAFGTVAAGAWTPVTLDAGQAAILYPEDGHAPRLPADAPSPVLKIVIKVAC